MLIITKTVKRLTMVQKTDSTDTVPTIMSIERSAGPQMEDAHALTVLSAIVVPGDCTEAYRDEKTVIYERLDSADQSITIRTTISLAPPSPNTHKRRE